MDLLSSMEPTQEVVLKFASQTGKTEVLNNFVGYVISHDPGPMLVIQPNLKPMGEAWSKDRLAPMISDTPILRSVVAESKGRDSANTILHKSFPGGHVSVGGSNSPAGLASRPIRYLALDEIDRYESTKEGDPISLATKRTRTFHNRKILKVSSPTYDDVGVDAAYKGCDTQYEWHLQCQHCGEFQFPRHRHFVYEGQAEGAQYMCEACGKLHSEQDEYRVKQSGKYVATVEGDRLRVGFWFNQWASPFARWRETVQEFLDAKDHPDKLQTCINTAFAETWQEAGETVDEIGLLSRRERYQIPDGVLVLVCAVDVQDDRLELEVIGYGDGEESWGIEYRVIYGDPAGAELWRDLDAVLMRKFVADDGRALWIQVTCVDSGGHHTLAVYDYCKQRKLRRVFAIKGVAGEGRPIIGAPSQKKYGKNPRPVELFPVGADQAKAQVYSSLRVSEPGPGYCHFPDHYSAEYFAQITAEKVVTRYLRGFPKREWVKTRPRNEALDIRAYALAGLRLLNPIWDSLRQAPGSVRVPSQRRVYSKGISNGD